LSEQHGFTSGELTGALDKLAEASNYADWITDLITPHVSGRVLEIGAGIGTISSRLVPHCDHLYVAEPHPASFVGLTARFASETSVTVSSKELPNLTDLNRMVMVNVLEHISDDAATVDKLHDMLTPGGKLILFVPAFPLLHSRFDDQIGHHRRYRKASLLAVLPGDNWEIDTMRYVNAPGFFLWWLGMRILKLSPADSAMTTIFDRYAVPIIRAIESKMAPPFGQSIFAVARKR
jgi:SAM-dependent methyltransferase